MSIRKLPNTSSPDEIAAVLEEDGVVCVKGFTTPETLNGLKQDLMPLLDTTPGGDDTFFLGNKTRRLARLFARTDHAVSVATNPLYLETARKILQSKPRKVWAGEHPMEVIPDLQIGGTQAIQIWPGQGAQPLHRDDAVFLWPHPSSQEARMNMMVALTEFTHENGATRVIPGSNKWGDERMPKVEETVTAEMSAGDALIWVGSTYHGGGENAADAPRTGIVIQLDLAYLRQEENQYLSIPIERMKALPEEIQRLLGWSRSETYGGWVEHKGQMVAPLELLKIDDFKEVGLIP
ncbi:phytanoyl-CoA dioxygenase family protein [Cupriavidus consociatus]|uniref:phytanoyl-CoA dioxygenase family protein n=1 Tax=Cupriavidus consociatus TaxID=2821357 RepID=UPI001AE1F56C|nr:MULTISPECIES: phytanoyl-CoA dioxygenase family protein [unclassified Cupriavidus]MBP0620909.1 phytanoyl-CoA dioxygenase family protein [Cupriavidus sp. LEh25]MDK2657574.1 phytanoyl-CoA dioxygenase family protein [Cupriavidus sp. LEh21]